jgi:hypothetical protein
MNNTNFTYAKSNNFSGPDLIYLFIDLFVLSSAFLCAFINISFFRNVLKAPLTTIILHSIMGCIYAFCVALFVVLLPSIFRLLISFILIFVYSYNLVYGYDLQCLYFSSMNQYILP